MRENKDRPYIKPYDPFDVDTSNRKTSGDARRELEEQDKARPRSDDKKRAGDEK